MSNATAHQNSTATATSTGQEPTSQPKKRKLNAFLVTLDDQLWPQVGVHLTQKLNHRQIDSIDELFKATKPGETAVVLWDARGAADQSALLMRLFAHSSRFAVVALDVAESASGWAPEIERGQVVAHVAVPVHAETLANALGNAYDEASARVALLGEGTSAGRPSTDRGAPQIEVFDNDLAEHAHADARAGDGNRILSAALRQVRGTRLPVMAAAGLLAIVFLVLVAYFVLQRPAAVPSLPPSASAVHPNKAAGAAPATSTGTSAGTSQSSAESAPSAAAEEKVDALISQAQIAMRDRHFIEPAEGSALSLYRSALLLDPVSGEAQQGLKRLAEVLVGRVQSALDEKQFDAALQALETVRSIDPNDSRLPALDARIAKMRDELGPAEIQAAINAQNFDRATQLIEQATRTKSLGESKLAQLREDLRRHRADSDVMRILALADARLQQNQLIDPPNDSAAFYLAQARKAGASANDLQPRTRDLVKTLNDQAHAAIEQRRLADADHIASALRSMGTPLSTVAGLQRDIGGARAQQAHEQSDQSRMVDLTRSRLAQGSVVGPENDSALYYLGQLRAADPQNAAVPQLTKAVQAQILVQAGIAIDAEELAQAESLLQLAGSLGSSPDADALAQRLRLAKVAASGAPKEVPEASLTRMRRLEIEYPAAALQRKIEGTVEIGFLVTPKGTVANIKVLDANPSGIFEPAATKAISRLRYKPVTDGGGKPIAVSTRMLVIFRPET
jgi:TonB family protein